MKSLSVKLILSALGVALLASSTLAAQRHRTPHYMQQEQSQQQPSAAEGAVDHGAW